jgi:hypothetical protein
LGQELGIRLCGCVTRGRGGPPSRPPRRANHAAFFSLLMGSSRKNGRLGDPALPSLSSNSFHVKHFHPKFLEGASYCRTTAEARRYRDSDRRPNPTERLLWSGLGERPFGMNVSLAVRVTEASAGTLKTCVSALPMR